MEIDSTKSRWPLDSSSSDTLRIPKLKETSSRIMSHQVEAKIPYIKQQTDPHFSITKFEAPITTQATIKNWALDRAEGRSCWIHAEAWSKRGHWMMLTLGSRPYLVMARSWAAGGAWSMLQLDLGVLWASLPHLGVVSGESPRLGVVRARSWRGIGAWITLGRENGALLELGPKTINDAHASLNTLESLKCLELEGGCMDMDSFPEDKLLPPNINSLCISTLKSLKKLDYKGFLTPECSSYT
ncbi:hypothetical protein PIB30_010147 [Stylosanthes scabra]|uniref:Uncharacterized protein n=1 Tax=Stylosanthes scabra TaxID=79078 RepID=A0ABU6Z255_9FABA|nr:hypothetical protein [Stylosanthes scabra]